MDTQKIEALLNEDESTSLDFKRDQYPFDSATDEQKAELLKDILAFANSWRRSDAFILIGVQEVRGGRSQPLGVANHLDDASLQQFVNAKTNRKVDFRYEAVPVDGVTVGVVHVPLQDRPTYLTKDFGKLKANTVYIRRGSSTDHALPDEIARMGAQTQATIHRTPRLQLVARNALRPGGDVIIFSITNEDGAGPARAPRLAIKRQGPFAEAWGGVDGNQNLGLPRIPQGSDSPYLTYGGDAGTVIPAGVTHDVAALEYRGRPESRPKEVNIEYELAAEGIGAIRDSITVIVS